MASGQKGPRHGLGEPWTHSPFFPVTFGIALTPGPNNLCALNHGLREGLVAALVRTTGRVVAFAIFLAVSAFGLGAMLLASETAFYALTWAGTAYLFWLGVQAWRSRDLGGRPIRRLVKSPRSARRLNRATGGVFMGAGGLLLAAHR